MCEAAEGPGDAGDPSPTVCLLSHGDQRMPSKQKLSCWVT